MLAIEKLAELGPMKVRDVALLVKGADKNVLSHSLMRAVDMGYLTVERGNRRADNCNVFKVVPKWREVHQARMDLYKKQPRKSRARIRTKWKGVNSVFSMGQMRA
jgi:hypothetical protein